jgi:hypothetical protein
VAANRAGPDSLGGFVAREGLSLKNSHGRATCRGTSPSRP